MAVVAVVVAEAVLEEVVVVVIVVAEADEVRSNFHTRPQSNFSPLQVDPLVVVAAAALGREVVVEVVVVRHAVGEVLNAEAPGVAPTLFLNLTVIRASSLPRAKSTC